MILARRIVPSNRDYLSRAAGLFVPCGGTICPVRRDNRNRPEAQCLQGFRPVFSLLAPLFSLEAIGSASRYVHAPRPQPRKRGRGPLAGGALRAGAMKPPRRSGVRVPVWTPAPAGACVQGPPAAALGGPAGRFAFRSVSQTSCWVAGRVGGPRGRELPAVGEVWAGGVQPVGGGFMPSTGCARPVHTVAAGHRPRLGAGEVRSGARERVRGPRGKA